ncbi:coiled-coil domain-containing protein 57 [Patella vulgata]|uniref:coiled-coil domain-containing protein 57 n=1 Tax=Patella vulgata TaxID=6465 RepID=UPI002180595F|nr:coiled-coil domain-containing protein 57 [Patella vulgata]
MNCEDPLSWKDLAEQKEREWKEFTHRRIESLEAAFKQKDKDLSEEKNKFQKLKDDFKYNFKLLQERDQELERYDAVLTNLKADVNNKNSEISELKVQVDEMRTQLKQEQKGREELQIHYQQRLKEKQAEVDSFRHKKEAEFGEERKEFEDFKRNLEQKLTKLDVEMDVQKRELNAGFDEAMKKRETEFRLKEDEMNAKVLEYDLKAKLLAKEIEYMKVNQKQVTDNFSEAEINSRLLEKKVKEKEWEIADLKAMKDAKIEDLNVQLKQYEVNMKRKEDAYENKHAEMDRCLREREEALSNLKTAYNEREQILNGDIRNLQSKLESAEIQIRQLQWTNQDLAKEKEIQTQNLSEELNCLQEKWNKNLADMSASQVSRDLEMHCLRENDSKLKTEILQKGHEIEKYKKELAEASEREAALIRSKTQLELDWQNRFEEAVSSQYGKSEDLMKKMVTAKYEMESGQSQEIKQLIQQNHNLKEVISQMKQQMQMLGYTNGSQRNTNNKDYTKSLEEQILNLKQQIRQLQDHHVQDISFNVSNDLDSEILQSPEVRDNIMVKDYIRSLNEQIRILKSEKSEYNVKFKKLESRLDNIETSSMTSKIMPQEDLIIEQLQGEDINLKKGIPESHNFSQSDVDKHDLQRKLRKAVKHITQIAKEKQQLIEVGNRLRGELKKAGITQTTPAVSTGYATNQVPFNQLSNSLTSHNPSRVTQESLNKLNQLEKLQYQLTKQELQFAQNFSPPRVTDSVQSSEVYYGRPSILKKSLSSQEVNKSAETNGSHYDVEPVLSSVQSMGGESIQEVWRMLDDGASPIPSVRTPRFLSNQSKPDVKERPDPNRELTVEGKKAELKLEEKRAQSRQFTISQTNKLKPSKKPQVRNYNMR